MKIPRYTGNVGSAPIQSGRTLTTGVGSAQGMVNLGQSMLDAVSTFATQKIEHVARQRDQEILDLATSAEGDSMMRANDFNFGLETRKDYKKFLPEYEKDWKAHTAKIKKDKFTTDGVFDEYAWSRYEPHHNKVFMEGKINVQTHISKTRNAQSITAYNTNYNQTELAVDRSTSVAQLTGNWEDWVNTKYTPYKGLATFDQGTLDTGYDALLGKVNNQMMLLQSGENSKIPVYKNPNGVTATDWSKVSERAADPTVEMFDVDGKPLTVDDPARAAFIKDARAKSNEQEGFDKSQRTENMRTDNNNFNQRLIGIYRGNVDDTFLKNLEENNTIDGPTKKTLASAYSTAVNARNEGKPYYDTIEGKKTESLVTAMVLSGMIDTEEEKSTVIKLAADGIISPDTARSLSGDIEKYQKDKNNHKLIMYRNAVKTVMKAAGAPPDIVQQMDALENLSGADLMTQLSNIMGSNMTPNAYKAVNNLTLLIAEGEKKGLTMNQMLMNPKSPAYLMNDLVQVYTDKAKEENVRNFELKAKGTNAYIMDDPKFGNYKIDPVGWAKYVESQGGTAQNIQVPPREENEPVNTYLLRLQKFNNKQAAQETGMPTFLRSDVVGGENTQTMIVIPD